MGDFTPGELDSRRLQTLWEWKNRVLLEEYYIFNVVIRLEVTKGCSTGIQAAALGSGWSELRPSALLPRPLTRLMFTDVYRFFGLSRVTSTFKNYHPEDSKHSGSRTIEFSSKSTTFLMLQFLERTNESRVMYPVPVLVLVLSTKVVTSTRLTGFR